MIFAVRAVITLVLSLPSVTVVGKLLDHGKCNRKRSRGTFNRARLARSFRVAFKRVSSFEI